MLDSFVERPVFSVARAGIIVMLTSSFAYLLKFASRIIIARELGPAGFGQFSIGIAVYTMLALFAGLGVPSAVVKLISAGKSAEYRRRVAQISLVTVTLSSLFVTFLALLLLPYLSSAFSVMATILLPFVLVVVFDLVFSTLRSVALGNGDSWIRAWLTDIGLALCYLFLVAGAAVFFKSPLASAVGFLLSLVVLCVIAFLYSVKKKYLSKVPTSTAEILSIVNYSIPFLLISVSSLVFVWTDALVIGYFLGSSDVGHYRAAATLVGVLSFVFSAITVLFLPIISMQYVQKRIDGIGHTYSMTVKWLAILIAPIGTVLAVFGRQILFYVFGELYLPAYPALFILTVFLVFVYILNTASQVLVAMDGQRTVSRVFAASALSNVLLNVVLVQHMGVTGAALATGFCLLFANAYLFFILASKGISPDHSQILLVIFAAVVSSVPTLFVAHRLDGFAAILLSLAVYCVTYLSLLLYSGVVREELNRLLGVLNTYLSRS